jgi:hypothetical protein
MLKTAVLVIGWACIALSALPLLLGWSGPEGLFATRCLVAVGVILNLAILIWGNE